jgi:hypothetical protein
MLENDTIREHPSKIIQIGMRVVLITSGPPPPYLFLGNRRGEDPLLISIY